MQKTLAIAALINFSLTGTALAASATMHGPTAYLQFDDSPFFSLFIGGASYQLEDFEGGFNATGVLASAGSVIGPGSLTDSVDADDGVVDGSGTLGSAYYPSAAALTFTFTGSLLPTRVGLVWTDVGNVPTGTFGVDTVTFEVFDRNGDSLGTLTTQVGDELVNGTTAEDRFFGATYLGGIASMRISSGANSLDWEVDHLQFGAPVPVPAAAWLFGSALLALAGANRSRPRAA